MSYNDSNKTKPKNSFLTGVLTVLVILNIIATLVLFAALGDDYNETEERDELISQIQDQSLTTGYFLSHQLLVDVTNQYNLNRNSSCEDITGRLSSVVRVLKESSVWMNETEQEQVFKDAVDALIDANKDNQNLVSDWERIEYCILSE